MSIIMRMNSRGMKKRIFIIFIAGSFYIIQYFSTIYEKSPQLFSKITVI